MSEIWPTAILVGCLLFLTLWAFAPMPEEPQRPPQEDSPDNASRPFPDVSPMRQRVSVGPGWRKTAGAAAPAELPELDPLIRLRLYAEIRTLTLDREDQPPCPSSPENTKERT